MQRCNFTFREAQRERERQLTNQTASYLATSRRATYVYIFFVFKFLIAVLSPILILMCVHILFTTFAKHKQHLY